MTFISGVGVAELEDVSKLVIAWRTHTIYHAISHQAEEFLQTLPYRLFSPSPVAFLQPCLPSLDPAFRRTGSTFCVSPHV
jgi:hypothetical protein